MFKRVKYLILISAVCFFPSCKKDFLDTKPLGEFNETDFWSSPGLVETFVNGIYKDVYRYPFSWYPLSVFSGDESFSMGGGTVVEFNKSAITADNIPGFYDGTQNYMPHLQGLQWGALYKAVRKTNLVFENINRIPVETNQKTIERFKGEAYFLRANLYHFLISLYGGVPLITRSYSLNDNFNVSRNTYEECVEFIVSQLDSAAMHLPLSYSGATEGRATKGAALGLKSRVLLYAASDLHHKMDQYAPGYSNPELLGYVNGSQRERWQRAKDAAKEVINLGMYSLYKADPAPGDSIPKNLSDYFLSRSATPEDMLLQYFSSQAPGEWTENIPAVTHAPNGFHGWGWVIPTSNLVDAFEFKDGSKFDWNNPQHKSSPYTNRDARFYATILYEGSDWRPRPTDVAGIDPWNKIQTGDVYDVSGNVVVQGADNGLIDAWGLFSGYFLRKFLDPAVDFLVTNQDVPFKQMRYAEILMNYAEACIELGEDGEAQSYINKIRTRAGQPTTLATGNELKSLYRNERRVEFAFEEQYFWDIRRWVAGPTAYHPISRVVIKYVAPDATSYRKPDGKVWGNPEYSTQVLAKYSWSDKAYFLPIRRSELNRSASLIQNPGY